MHDINFDCPACGQNLDTPPDLAGLYIECPACKAIVKVPPIPAAGKQRPAGSDAQTPLTPPPAQEKSATMRINLPPDLDLPPPPQRRLVIKRPKA